MTGFLILFLLPQMILMLPSPFIPPPVCHTAISILCISAGENPSSALNHWCGKSVGRIWGPSKPFPKRDTTSSPWVHGLSQELFCLDVMKVEFSLPRVTWARNFNNIISLLAQNDENIISLSAQNYNNIIVPWKRNDIKIILSWKRNYSNIILFIRLNYILCLKDKTILI